MTTKEANVISKKTNKEMITSHKLSITVLIRNFCLYRDDGLSDEFVFIFTS